MTPLVTLLPRGRQSVASEVFDKTRAEKSTPLPTGRNVRLFCVFFTTSRVTLLEKGHHSEPLASVAVAVDLSRVVGKGLMMTI